MPTVIKGVFSANAKGYGFVINDNGEDIFIPPDKVNGALHYDTVECTIKRSTRTTRPEGTITRLISRGRPQMSGTFYADQYQSNKNQSNKKSRSGNITPLEANIPYYFPIAPVAIKKLGLIDGHRVMFKVSLDGRVTVTEILGHKNDPGVDVISIVRQYGVPYEFSEKVQEAAAVLPKTVTAKDRKGRVDLRNLHIITIDGSDTKDIDDAISLDVMPGGHYELGVHIADVSYYVPAKSVIDLEARARGTSIYLADRVIPMLPHLLSNGICSLNPGVDRLALSCIMEIDGSGDVVDYRIEETVINSKRKYTYDEVLELIDTETDTKTDTETAAETAAEDSSYFRQMNALAEILRKKRKSRGALDFDLNEAKIIVDDQGFPIDIEVKKATAATSLIEEFMIVCNETIAEHIKDDAAFVYRTHERPDTDKMYQLSAYAQSLGHDFAVSSKGVSPKTLQKLLNELEPKSEAQSALKPFILRCLKQARYTEDNIGHFGLASRRYCHFTSPIRRYPDLLVHRSIKGGLRKRGLADLCLHCSKTERTAEALERDVAQLKKCQFMADKLGQVFDGVVSGVVAWGVFVELSNTVEGMIPLNFFIDDEYVFVEKQMALFGARKKNRIRLGDPITVELSRVDVEERKITFAPRLGAAISRSPT